jgi:hypothetical protein
MPKDQREPQSYGSEKDWVSGRTGQEVNDQDGAPAPEHREFYDESRESERSASENHQGGRVSEVQLAENVQPTSGHVGQSESPVSKVTVAEGGRKTGGYFKKRDYE